ncbi:MAG TPA: glutamate--tRNA ligase [Thermoanaerobaculia bacterium]|nr:glutamate--tRNA ligase [Thermoanaerobaculia bacterium]
MQETNAPRVRFAPSPTGSLHVGGARTALYNLLFARNTGGTFLLRIEDTDVERSREELTGQILSAMEWLGLDYDEGPFFQSKRYDLYTEAANRLLREGKAYRAFETPEQLDSERKKAEASGRAYRYSGAGRAIPLAESDRRAAAGERHVVRLRMPDETLVVDDLIRGRVDFPPDALDDFVLVRSDGHPLYHFCVCVDDTDMRITHVIRGDDHLANTPKHVALFHALSAPVPKFAHLGMILGTDRKKLSKRHGAAAVEEWRDEGILPEALFNFLALLGWAPGGDREILTRAEMEREFSLDKVGASPSVFDPEKLLWMNSQYIAAMPAEELLRRSLPHAAGGAPDPAVALRAIELHRPRVRTPIEMGRALSSYARDPDDYEAEGMKKHVKPDTARQLEALVAGLEVLPDWTAASAEAVLRRVAEAEQISAGKLIHPTRLALTGTTVGAPLFDVVELLGKQTSLRRLGRFIEAVKARTPA